MIEELKAEDQSAAYRLMAELGYKVNEKQFFENISHLQQQNGTILVAKANADVVGLIAVRFNVSLEEGIYGKIIALVVSSGKRRKGIGKALVQKAEEWLSIGARLIRVRSNILRDEAHKFYIALGYIDAKTQKLYKKIV